MSGAMRGEQMATRLAVTQAMADELNDYLMGNDLYRQTLVETPVVMGDEGLHEAESERGFRVPGEKPGGLEPLADRPFRDRHPEP